MSMVSLFSFLTNEKKKLHDTIKKRVYDCQLEKTATKSTWNWPNTVVFTETVAEVVGIALRGIGPDLRAIRSMKSSWFILPGPF